MKKLLKAIYLYTLLFTLILNLNTITYNVSNEIDCITSNETVHEFLPFNDKPDNNSKYN